MVMVKTDIISAFLRGQQELTGHDFMVTHGARTNKMSKDDALYGFPPPDDGSCKDCDGFETVPGTADGAGTCKRVFGICQPDSGCLEFHSMLTNRHK